MPSVEKPNNQASEVERSTGHVRRNTLLPRGAPLYRRGGPAGGARLRARYQGHGGLRLLLRAGPQREGRGDRLGERLRGSKKRRREQQEGHGVGGAEPQRASSAEPGVCRRASRRVRGVPIIVAGSSEATRPHFVHEAGPGSLSGLLSSSYPYPP